jgi:hypothetical protein
MALLPAPAALADADDESGLAHRLFAHQHLGLSTHLNPFQHQQARSDAEYSLGDKDREYDRPRCRYGDFLKILMARNISSRNHQMSVF